MPDDDLYDLSPQPPKSKPVPAAPTPVVSTSPPVKLAYRAPQEDAPRSSDPETIKNLYMPMWLLGGGVAIEVIAALIHSGFQLQAAFAAIGIQVVLGTAVMLIGILLAAKLRQIDLGSFWTAVFKLSAISIAPSALVTLLTPIVNLLIAILQIIPYLGSFAGLIVPLAIQFILYFALLGALFDLDESDTWFCVWIIFLIRVAVYFSMMAIGFR